MLTILSFALCNACVRAYNSAYWKVVVGRRLFVFMIVYVVLFGCPLIIAYPVLAVVVVEAFVEQLSTNQVGVSGMGVSKM
jgi:hypothetical protein